MTAHPPTSENLAAELAQAYARIAALESIQQQNQDALQQIQLRLNRSEAMAHLGSWEYELATNQIRWSDEVYRIFGLLPQAFQATFEAYLQAIHPDDRELVHNIYRGSVNLNQDGFELEHRIVWPTTGETRYVNCHCQHIRDEQGQIVRSLGIVLDISARKEAEIALIESESKFATIFHAEPIALSITGVADGKILEVNDAFCNLCGYSRSEILGRTTQDLNLVVNPSQRQHLMQLLQLNGFVAEFESKVRKKSGEILDLLISAKLLRLSEQPCVLAVCVDMTSRIYAEEALRESEERFFSAFAFAAIGMALIAPDGRWLKVNQAFCRMVGYDGAELLRMRFQEITYPEDLTHSLALLQKLLTGKLESYQIEKRYLHKTGGIVWAQLSISLVRDEFGSPKYLISQIQDISARKHTEAELQEARDLLETALRESPSGILIADAPNVTLRLANPAALSVRGQSHQNFKGLDVTQHHLIWNTFKPDGTAYPAEELPLSRAVLNGERIQNEEVLIQDEAGYLHTFMTNAAPIRDKNNQITAGIVVFHDITALKMAEKTQREMATLLANVLNSTPDMIYIKDLELRTVLCNHSFAKALGKKPEDLLGHTDIENGWTPELVLGDPSKGIHGFVNDDQTVLGGQAVHNPYDPANVGDEIRIFDTHKLPMYDAKGDIIGVLGVSRDVTELKKAEAIRLQGEAKFRNIIEVSPVPYALNDAVGNITYLNPAFIKTFGYTLQEIPTLSEWWVKAYPDETYREWAKETWRLNLETATFNKISAEPIEVTIQCRDRSQKMVLVGAVSLGESFEGNHLVVLYDITELRTAEAEKHRLQERLIQSQKMETVGRLAGGVAHDFNNMLTVIMGNTEMAMLETTPESKIYARLEEIYQAAGRSSELTRQLLAFARKQSVTPKVLDLNETLQSTINILKRLMRKNIDLVWKPSAGLWPVKMDPTQVHQIVVNLCINARDAIKNEGLIAILLENIHIEPSISVRSHAPGPGDYVLLQIRDNGVGIHANMMGSIFEPFFTTKPPGEGSGLGLSIVYGIISQNHGFIEVESLEGQGTVFKIYLPRHGTPVTPPQVSDTQTALPHGKATLLLVDDEPAILSLNCNMLTKIGYDILTASTPREAIALAQNYPAQIDLLLTDVLMPEMNGYELAEQILTLYPAIKLVFISGYTSDKFQPQPLNHPFHFIEKPCSMTQLAAKIQAVLTPEA